MGQRLLFLFLVIILISSFSPMVFGQDKPSWANSGAFLKYGWTLKEYVPVNDVDSEIYNVINSPNANSIITTTLLNADNEKGTFTVNIKSTGDSAETQWEYYWSMGGWRDGDEAPSFIPIYSTFEKISTGEIENINSVLGTFSAHKLEKDFSPPTHNQITYYHKDQGICLLHILVTDGSYNPTFDDIVCDLIIMYLMDTNIQLSSTENDIDITVDVVPGLGNVEAINDYIELAKIVDTNIFVTIDKNAHLVSFVSLEYKIGHGILLPTFETHEMELQSDSRYVYNVKNWDTKVQDNSAGILGEYFVSGVMKLLGVPGGTMAPIFTSVNIPDYTLTKIIIKKTDGSEIQYNYDLPIQSVWQQISSSGGTIGVTLSPVDFILSDSKDRYLGSLYEMENYLPVFKNEINQISGAYYNREAEFFYLPSTVLQYNISFIGLDSGQYTLVTLTVNDETEKCEEKECIIQKGEIQSFSTEISNDGKLTISEIQPLAFPKFTSDQTISLSLDVIIGIIIIVVIIIVSIGVYFFKRRRAWK